MNQRFGALAALKGAILMTGTSVTTYTIGLLVSAVIARHLGPEDYGRYAYVVWLSGVMVMAGNNGLTTTGIRFVAEALGRDAPKVADAVGNWLYRRQLACILVVVAAFLLAFPALRPSGWSDVSWLFVTVVVISMAAKALYLFEISIAKGHGRFDIEATSSIVASLLNAGLVFLLYWHDASLNSYLVLFAGISAIYFVMAAFMFRRHRMPGVREELDTEFLSRMRKHLLWTVVLTLVGAFSGSTVFIYMLNALVGPAEVGFFVIGASLSRGAIDLVATGLTSVLMPMMGHAFGAGGKEKVGAILSDSLRYLQFLGLLAGGVGIFWADAIILLVYGEAYSTASSILQWMLFAAGLVLGEGAFGALMSTTDNQRLRAAFATSHLVVSVAAAVALIPPYGLDGAVVGYVAARLVLYVIGLVVVVRMMAVRLPWRQLGGIFLACALSATAAGLPVLAFPGPWIAVPAGLLFAGLFVAASPYLGVWKEKDLRLVLSLGEQHPRILGWTRSYFARWIARLQR